MRWWNFHLLEMQCTEIACSTALELQIYSNILALKLDARSNGWKHLDLAQFQKSIAMSLHLCSSNSCSILQTSGWILLSDAPWSWLCKENEGLCEENWKSKWENFGGKLRFWIWKVSYEQKQLGFGFYMVH